MQHAIPQFPDRALHLVDLDNLVGGPWNGHKVPEVLAGYLVATRFRAGDHLVVAAEKALAKAALFQVPGHARFLMGTGPDGADRRLLSAVPLDLIASRYAALVIGSGDRCFEDLAWQVGGLGVPVTVVSYRSRLSWKLARAAGGTILLGAPRPPAPPARVPAPVPFHRAAS